jgi:hypothetical protein
MRCRRTKLNPPVSRPDQARTRGDTTDREPHAKDLSLQPGRGRICAQSLADGRRNRLRLHPAMHALPPSRMALESASWSSAPSPTPATQKSRSAARRWAAPCSRSSSPFPSTRQNPRRLPSNRSPPWPSPHKHLVIRLARLQPRTRVTEKQRNLFVRCRRHSCRFPTRSILLQLQNAKI